MGYLDHKIAILETIWLTYSVISASAEYLEVEDPKNVLSPSKVIFLIQNGNGFRWLR